MNKDKITAMCRKVSNETGLTFNSVMTYYFLESVLRKLSISKYNDKFIFKGGYILSNIVGIDSRSTVDIATGDILTYRPLEYEYKTIW